MSLSDDEKNKKKYQDFINKCFDIASSHENFCNTNCFKDNTTGWFPHTKQCIEYRDLHHGSFVECNSIFCLKMNETQRLKPSYVREKKEVVYTELTFCDSDDE